MAPVTEAPPPPPSKPPDPRLDSSLPPDPPAPPVPPDPPPVIPFSSSRIPAKLLLASPPRRRMPSAFVIIFLSGCSSALQSSCEVDFSGVVESSGNRAPLLPLLRRRRASQICRRQLSSSCRMDLHHSNCRFVSSPPWPPCWIYVWVKPTASLLQIYAPSGPIFAPSWNISDKLESLGSARLGILCASFQYATLPQVEVFEILSSISHVSCFLICDIKQPLPLYEDFLPLCEDSLPLCEDLLPLCEDSLPLCEDLLPLCEDLLPPYEVHLPQYEQVVIQDLYSVFVLSFALLVLLPHDAGLHFWNTGVVSTMANLRSLVSDSFTGSSRRCFVVSVAKILVASFALVAEACSGNVSPSVLSFSLDFISLSTVDVIISSCLNGLFVFISYVYASRFATVAAVDYASLAFVFCFSNFCSVFGD